jgi:hypothetical protein
MAQCQEANFRDAQLQGADFRNTALIASGNPVNPSTQAIRISLTPRLDSFQEIVAVVLRRLLLRKDKHDWVALIIKF